MPLCTNVFRDHHFVIDRIAGRSADRVLQSVHLIICLNSLESAHQEYPTNLRNEIKFYGFRGLWNVPFISNCYLINATLIRSKETRPSYLEGDLDTDMAFAHANRERFIFMYVSNRFDYGHLVNPDSYDLTVTHPDLYQILDNKFDWERRYIHQNYSGNFNPNRIPMQV